MNVWKEINWFAIHTNARRENFAATNIGALGAEVLVPRLKVERLVRGIIRTVTKPLFPGYFFARFSPVLLLDLIRSSRGVLRIVSAGRLPLPLDDDIIPAVVAQMDEEGCVRLQQRPLRPGDRVRVEQGPLHGMIGQLERECDDRNRVIILLEAIQQARVSVEKRWLSPETAMS